MTSNELYKEFLIKVNKNDTNANVKISKGQFVLLYNQKKRDWLSSVLKNDSSTDEVLDLGEVLETDVELSLKNDKDTKTSFELPPNFFKHVGSYSLASKGNCHSKRLTNWPVKPKNLNNLLISENNKPSFEYEETLTVISQNSLEVYKNDFKVDKVFLTYYREPKDIDISGYIRIDGTPSVDIDPELSNALLDDILKLCAIEVTVNNQNAEAFKLNSTRLKQ